MYGKQDQQILMMATSFCLFVCLLGLALFTNVGLTTTHIRTRLTVARSSGFEMASADLQQKAAKKKKQTNQVQDLTEVTYLRAPSNFLREFPSSHVELVIQFFFPMARRTKFCASCD